MGLGARRLRGQTPPVPAQPPVVHQDHTRIVQALQAQAAEASARADGAEARVVELEAKVAELEAAQAQAAEASARADGAEASPAPEISEPKAPPKRRGS